ncbi:unnamed protein product [Microthlaspi erraticum]|uniref:Disease resistance R13L4/SHOC-2-like LRR domain-containing protein n=1 Tax=Microthlaspi erraticum TaxID=1685480 RepID=A0A6D2IYW4_9BRAS|nr:unnamed protein product [Microthlaspi erraticum]
MLPYELTQSVTGGNTIDSIIETANQLYKVIQLQDAYQDTDQGSKEEHEHAKEHMIVTSKSIGGEIVEERLPEMPTTGGTGLERAKSAPLRNLSPPVSLIRLLKSTLLRLKRNLKHMQSLQSDVEKELKEQLESLTLVVKGVEPSTALHMSSAEQMEKSLDYMIKKLLDLISMVPVSLEKLDKKKESTDQEDDGSNNHRRRVVCLPAIHGTEKDLKGLAVSRDVQGKFEKLSSAHLRICLLSFAVFPENQEVNGTMLMYWWIGEGILPDGDKPEVAVKNILKEFTEKKLIEPVRNKYKVEPSSYKMTPFVHSSVVLISKEIGLFDMYHQGTKPTMNKSALNKVCLVEGSSSEARARGRIMDADGIETVFNVSERFPDFTYRWFSSMKNLKVLYLGSWQRSVSDIEMHNRRVMKDLGFLRKLRLLSFQGISTIKSLSRSASKLTELIVLDLRGCDYLEKLPDDIHKLKNLVYLDMTGCDALESIPLGLSWLSSLEVLKGFVIRDDEKATTCHLMNLVHLQRLRKLSIIVDRVEFRLDALFGDIAGFKALEKLKLRWGRRISLSKKQLEDRKPRSIPDIRRAPEEGYHLPKQLRKLDLQRFPDSELPGWLQPQNLKGLEKLHLRSWTDLKGFGALPKKPTDCGVTVLRLTCLQKLKVDWRELRQLYFPKLNFVEMYECPGVTFCPCDEDGIWRSDEWEGVSK